MTFWFIRGFFLIITSFMGYYLGAGHFSALLGIGIGLGSGVILIFLEASLKRVSVQGLSSMVFGLLLGVFMAKLVSDILSLLPVDEFVRSSSRVILTIVFSYLGAMMALRGKNEFHVIIPYIRFKRQDIDSRVVLLDTSTIIDGRITDIYKTNFFVGRVVIPRFVLQELQKLADSQDPVKRQRGRRGLDIIRNIQKNNAIDIRIHEDNIPDEETDAQLIRLAKMLEAAICTLDFNLSRVAAIQGIQTLNINELVNAVKPVMFPGEEMDVHLLREGKEPDQAVAYTDDGTMIVVSHAREMIGKDIKILVVSVLQTQAGRMIFGKPKE